MKDIMDYMIIKNVSTDVLEDAVNNLLNKGWELLGAPFVRQREICQCMVKHRMRTADEIPRGGY